MRCGKCIGGVYALRSEGETTEYVCACVESRLNNALTALTVERSARVKADVSLARRECEIARIAEALGFVTILTSPTLENILTRASHYRRLFEEENNHE